MVRSLGQEDPLEEGTVTHSSILAWRIPRTTVHGVSQSRTRLKRLSTHAHIQTHTLWFCCFVCLFSENPDYYGGKLHHGKWKFPETRGQGMQWWTVTLLRPLGLVDSGGRQRGRGLGVGCGCQHTEAMGQRQVRERAAAAWKGPRLWQKRWCGTPGASPGSVRAGQGHSDRHGSAGLSESGQGKTEQEQARTFQGVSPRGDRGRGGGEPGWTGGGGGRGRAAFRGASGLRAPTTAMRVKKVSAPPRSEFMSRSLSFQFY